MSPLTRDDTAAILHQLGQELRWARLELMQIDAENRRALRKHMGLSGAEGGLAGGALGDAALGGRDEQDATCVEGLSRQPVPAFSSPRRGLQLVTIRRAAARPATQRKDGAA